MLKLRRADERGHADHGWLNTFHTFSFGSYYDPDNMGFRSLRVMNEDRVAPGQGFGTHAHQDMEIVSYVLAGSLEHKDSMGNGETLRPGEFQRITAGTGITHSEYNPSGKDEVHFYQIWLIPERKGLKPEYEQKSFPSDQRNNHWQLVASPTAEANSLKIHQDVKIFLCNLDHDNQIDHRFDSGRHGWLQVLRGSVTVDGESLAASDGVAISDHSTISIHANEPSELMLFDLS